MHDCLIQRVVVVTARENKVWATLQTQQYIDRATVHICVVYTTIHPTRILSTGPKRPTPVAKSDMSSEKIQKSGDAP